MPNDGFDNPCAPNDGPDLDYEEQTGVELEDGVPTRYGQTFWPKAANAAFPEGCKCGNNGGGECEWCDVYYNGPQDDAGEALDDWLITGGPR